MDRRRESGRNPVSPAKGSRELDSSFCLLLLGTRRGRNTRSRAGIGGLRSRLEGGEPSQEGRQITVGATESHRMEPASPARLPANPGANGVGFEAQQSAGEVRGLRRGLDAGDRRGRRRGGLAERGEAVTAAALFVLENREPSIDWGRRFNVRRSRKGRRGAEDCHAPEQASSKMAAGIELAPPNLRGGGSPGEGPLSACAQPLADGRRNNESMHRDPASISLGRLSEGQAFEPEFARL